MKTRNRIILFKGDIETLGYFSIELAKTFSSLGDEVYLFDFEDEAISMIGLIEFLKAGPCCMVSFNFTGMNGLDLFQYNENFTIWDYYNVLCINIIVDHPFYYHIGLEDHPRRFALLCVDRLHLQYVKRFFPEIQNLYFLPLAGTERQNYQIPYVKRTKDIVFTGNYTPPDTFKQHITRINEEYTEFYYRILADMEQHPNLPIEQAIEQHIYAEVDEKITENDIREIMPNMIFLDLYIRFFFRGEVLKTLVDAGYPVHVYGSGWEKLACRHKENLLIGGPLNSDECLQQIAQAKISLNVMPWFKEGAHDRIYNSMLNKAVCLTDSSRYLDKQLTNREDVLLYSLDNLADLPAIVEEALTNDTFLQCISEQGYAKAKEAHTWHHRALTIQHIIETLS